MIKVNNKEVSFQEGITVLEAVKLAGESIDHIVIVMVDRKVISNGDLNMTTVADNTKIALLRLISGG